MTRPADPATPRAPFDHDYFGLMRYAQGVADVLAWLNGAEPSTALAELLS